MKSLILVLAFLYVHAFAAEPSTSITAPQSWQPRAADRARILSQVKWTPVADTMPNRSGGFFQKGRLKVCKDIRMTATP